MTTRRAFAILVAGALWGACSDDASDITGPAAPDAALVLSDTALGGGFAPSRVPGSSEALPSSAPHAGSDASANVAYVSLAPGTAPRGVSATIGNRRTGSIVSIVLLNGGFDPVPVVARPGDILEIEVQGSDGITLLRYVRTVPGKRPPKVVRTNPPGGKRDVALNTRIVVVFSEPIDVATLNAASIRLLRSGTPVTGRLEFEDAGRLSAVFIPASALTAGTEYELLVTENVRDLDGETLEAPVRLTFTTVAPTDGTLLTRVAFSDGHSISVVTAEGADFTRLIDDGGQRWEYMSPAWSPDGSQIAFGSNRDGGWDIYVMNADGSGVTRLTTHAARDDEPAWSPDGTRIAFTSDRDGDFEIYVINANGSGLRQLTDHLAQDGNPAWSPDGSRIAFTSDRDGLNELYVMNNDGTGVMRLTNVSDEAIHPEWSPNGLKLLFTRSVAGQYIMDADGSNLTSLNVQGSGATWSPDGSRIVFSSGNLFVINADGTGLRDLHVAGFEPAWGPSGPIVSNPVPAAGAVLVDASRDGGVWWFPQWSEQGGFDPDIWHQGTPLAHYLRGHWYRVDELPRPFPITPELLSSYDIVIRASGFGTYTEEEITAYRQWVAAGGRLLLAGDHMMNLAEDQLAKGFGLEFAGITRGENILKTLPHPVTQGVGDLGYGVGSGLVSFPASAEIIGRLSTGSYLDLNLDGALQSGEPLAPAVLGVMPYGAGRILFCGDMNLWNSAPQPLLDNVLQWFRTP